MHTNVKLLLFVLQGLLLLFLRYDFFFLSSSCCIFSLFLPTLSPVCGFQITSISLFSPPFTVAFLSYFSFCGCQRRRKLQPASPNCSNTPNSPGAMGCSSSRCVSGVRGSALRAAGWGCHHFNSGCSWWLLWKWKRPGQGLMLFECQLHFYSECRQQA